MKSIFASPAHLMDDHEARIAQRAASAARQEAGDGTPDADITPSLPSRVAGVQYPGQSWPVSGDDIARARKQGDMIVAHDISRFEIER